MAAKAWSLTVPADDRYNYQIPGDIRDVKQHAQVAASLYAEAQATPDQTIAIYAGTVYFGPTRVDYAGNDDVDLGTSGTYEVAALTADYYNKVLITLNAAGTLTAHEGTEAAAAGSVVEPLCPTDEYPICIVTVQDDGTGTAGTINAIEQSEITQVQRVASIPMITADTTFYCDPAGSDTLGDGSSSNPWFSPHHAFEVLNGYAFGSDVDITIQMNDGTFDLSSNGILYMHHPQGGQISILGETNAATTELQGTWLYCYYGHTIKLVNKITISGSSGTGIWAANNSHISCGSNLIVDGTAYGIRATYQSSVNCNQIKLVDITSYGIAASWNSFVNAQICDIDNCGTAAVMASNMSTVDVTGGDIDHDGVGGNGTYGIISETASFVNAYTITMDTSGHISTDYSPSASTGDTPSAYLKGGWIYIGS